MRRPGSSTWKTAKKTTQPPLQRYLTRCKASCPAASSRATLTDFPPTESRWETTGHDDTTKGRGRAMTDAAIRHQPVMLERCVDLLAPSLDRPGSIAIDGTLGMGGHTESILERCPQATVVGIDRDLQAIALAFERLSRFGDRFVAHHAEYDDITGALERVGAKSADGILLD